MVLWKPVTKTETDESGEETASRRLILRYYTVFNVEQCDLPADKLPAVPDLPEIDFDPIPECEAILAGMPSAPAMDHREQRAYYAPGPDRVNMPRPETFVATERYFGTLLPRARATRPATSPGSPARPWSTCARSAPPTTAARSSSRR